MKCLCGFELPEADEEQQIREMQEHVGRFHAELGLGENQVRDFVASGRRARPWDGTRKPLPQDLELRRLSPALLDEFLDFFDHDAFADNPAYGGCYCMAQHFPGGFEEWKSQRGIDNRQEMARRIQEGRASGILALGDGKVLGWCNAGPQAQYPGLRRYEGMDREPEEGVGSLVCFVVAPAYRKQGLTARLVESALDLLRDQGCRVAEAYPFREASPFGIDFLGTRELFLAAGFSDHREAGPVSVMRREL